MMVRRNSLSISTYDACYRALNNVFGAKLPINLQGGAVYACVSTNVTLTGCSFIAGTDKSVGHNDVARREATSNVDFVCGDSQCGSPYQMQGSSVQPADVITCAPVSSKRPFA